MTAVRRHPLPIGVAICALAACAVMFAPGPVVIRAPLVLAVALIGPGAAVVPLLALDDLLGELTLAIGVSLSCDVLIALVMLYAGAWSQRAGLAILAILMLAGASVQIAVAEKRR